MSPNPGCVTVGDGIIVAVALSEIFVSTVEAWVGVWLAVGQPVTMMDINAVNKNKRLALFIQASLS
jgi:hypothetical protein